MKVKEWIAKLEEIFNKSDSTEEEIKELEKALDQLSPRERREILSFIESHEFERITMGRVNLSPRRKYRPGDPIGWPKGQGSYDYFP